MFPDAVGQLINRRRIEVAARLERITIDEFKGNLIGSWCRRCRGGVHWDCGWPRVFGIVHSTTEQSTESSTQSSLHSAVGLIYCLSVHVFASNLSLLCAVCKTPGLWYSPGDRPQSIALRMTGVKSPVYCVIGIIVKVNAVRIFEFCEAAESAGRASWLRKSGLNKRLKRPKAARL